MLLVDVNELKLGGGVIFGGVDKVCSEICLLDWDGGVTASWAFGFITFLELTTWIITGDLQIFGFIYLGIAKLLLLLPAEFTNWDKLSLIEPRKWIYFNYNKIR